MTVAELESLLSTGESDQLEFKRSTSLLRAGCDTLCSFLNSQAALERCQPPPALREALVHASRPRNLLIADVFFRRGLIERFGRGTLVIVKECQRDGCSEPSNRVGSGCFVVTFSHRAESQPDSELARGVLLPLENGPLDKVAMAEALGHRSISASLNRMIRGLLADGRIAITIPKKPNSRLPRNSLVPSSETTARVGAKLDRSTGSCRFI